MPITRKFDMKYYKTDIDIIEKKYQAITKKLKKLVIVSSETNLKRALYFLNKKGEFNKYAKNLVGLPKVELYAMFFENLLNDLTIKLENCYTALKDERINLKQKRRKKIELKNCINDFRDFTLAISNNKSNNGSAEEIELVLN